MWNKLLIGDAKLSLASRLPQEVFSDPQWEDLLQRWRRGAYRAAFFRDLVLAEAQRWPSKPVILDIGCGRGFDGERGLQASLAEAASQYLGVEPDASIRPSRCFAKVFPCRLEDAPLAPGSIDVAFAVFVLEHLARPQAFFEALFTALRPGGVFWGFTIDRRHPFAIVSLAAEWLGLKSWLLRRLGDAESYRGPGHYPVYYRANTPAAIRRLATRFRSIRTATLHQEGQFDAYLPSRVRPLSRLFDRICYRIGVQGPMLVARLEK